MNVWTRTLMTVMLLACLMGWVVGCASTPKEPAVPEEAVFYPPPPDEPRLQFLTSFSDAEHWVTTKSSFSDFIVGADELPEAIGTMHGPYGVAVHDGKLYVCDIPLHTVHIYDMANQTYSRLGQPDTFFGPVNITIADDGKAR